MKGREKNKRMEGQDKLLQIISKCKPAAARWGTDLSSPGKCA